MTADMAGHVSPTSGEAQMGMANGADEILVDDLDLYALAESAGIDWENLDFDAVGFSAVDVGSYPAYNGSINDSNSEGTEPQMPEELLVGQQSEGPKRPVLATGDNRSIDDMLAADGLPADTFDKFKRQPNESAMTKTYAITHCDSSEPIQQHSVRANPGTLQGIEESSGTPAQPSPRRTRALGISELLNSPILSNSNLRLSIEAENHVPSPDKASSSLGDNEEHDEEEERESPRARQVGRKRRLSSDEELKGTLRPRHVSKNQKSGRFVKAEPPDTKHQKQEIEPAIRPAKEAPRPLVKQNPRYVPNEDYSHENHPCEDWDDFRYSRHGELKPSMVYSAAQINHYLWKHPLHQGAADKTASELVLRVHRNPSRSATRFPTTLSHRCRFEHCPVGTINQGHISVSFSEIDKSHPDHDPFLEAGWIHLYCLERITDFPRVCAELNILADTRVLTKEENGKNIFRFGTPEEEKVVEKFIKACRADKLPDNYPEQIEGEEYEYEGTLCHRLALTKVKKEPGAYGTQRFVREGLAGYKGSNISNHLGDLVLEAQLRKKTRLHKNQNSNLENPAASREYRDKRRADSNDEDGSQSEDNAGSEREDEDDDDEAEMQEKWIREAEQRPRQRRVPVANMGQAQSSSKPSQKPQRPLSTKRAPTRDDRVLQEWVQMVEAKPRPRRVPPELQHTVSPHRAPKRKGRIVDNRLQSFESQIERRAPTAQMGYPNQPQQSYAPYQAPNAFSTPQYPIPPPYTEPPPQLSGQYQANHPQHMGYQGQPRTQFPLQDPHMPHKGPPAAPSQWTPVHPDYRPTSLTALSSRKRSSDEAGNDHAPMRYGQVPEHRQMMSTPQLQQPPEPQPPSRKRRRDEPHDETNDDIEEPWQKRVRQRLAPSPPKKRNFTPKKAKAPYHYKTIADKKLERKREANVKEEWEKMYGAEAVGVRREMVEARQRGDIADADLVVLTNDMGDEPSPQERRPALQRIIEDNRRRVEMEREYAEFMQAAEEEGEEDEDEEVEIENGDGEGLFGDDEEEKEEDVVARKKKELEEQMMRQRAGNGKKRG